MSYRVVLGVVLAGALSGCSSGASSGPQLAVQGTVSQAVQVDDARAVAIGTDGRTFWSYLDAQRDFTLLLPVGQSYRIVIANARPEGGEVIVGHLVVRGTTGATDWLGANAAGTVDLGTLGSQSESTLESAHVHGQSGGDHSDDDQCHEGGHHGGGGGGDGVCDDGQDEPLWPTKDPGSKCDDHDHHSHHGHHGSHCDAGKDHEADGGDDDGDDPPCPHGDAGHKGDAGSSSDAGAGNDAGAGTDAGGGGGVGAECLTNADCAANLACIAGFCTAI